MNVEFEGKTPWHDNEQGKAGVVTVGSTVVTTTLTMDAFFKCI